MNPGQKTTLIVMTKLTFQDELKKDFYELQESIIIKQEAYEYYCALRMAQKGIVRYDVEGDDLENAIYALEKLREYFMGILLLKDFKMNLLSLNSVEGEMYVSALNDKLAKLKSTIPVGKDKQTLEAHKDKIRIIQLMLAEFETGEKE